MSLPLDSLLFGNDGADFATATARKIGPAIAKGRRAFSFDLECLSPGNK
jgi:hypothetical protein